MIGFGHVGQGFTQILLDQRDDLARQFELNLQIVAVCDLLKGSIYNPEGFSPSDLLATVQGGHNLENLTNVHARLGCAPNDRPERRRRADRAELHRSQNRRTGRQPSAASD